MSVERLPADLASVADLGALNARVRSGAATLDWSALASAPREPLVALLAGLDLVDDADALGLDTLPRSLIPAVEAVLAGTPPEKAAPSAKTEPGPRGALRGIEADIRLSPSVNYAMQQNDVRFVRGIVLRNAGLTDARDLQVRLTSQPPIIDPIERTVALLRAGETLELGDVRPLLLRDALLQPEREAGHVTLEVLAEGKAVTATRAAIQVLAFNEWDATSPFPELTAAFVMPNDPAVERLLSRRREVLSRDGGGDAALSGYQKGDATAVLRMVAAIYESIATEAIGYCVPPASFEKTGQKVRTPSQIMESRLATCLDLAFLFSACCEQAGLNPVIFFVRGHSFAGVWIIEEKLRTASSTDVAELRKRIDLRHIVAAELTGLCNQPALPFANAIAEARGRLSSDSEFERALDVGMARASGVRPLPLHGTPVEEARVSKAAGGVESDGVEGALPEDWRPPSDEHSPDYAEPPRSETPSQRLDRWKHELLDLTLRNRLLNFKDGKKTIPIRCPDLGALEDALAQGKPFKVHPAASIQGPTDPRDPVAFRQRAGTDSLDEYLRQGLTQRRLYSTLPEDELQARLTETYRTARLSLEEGGANTLFLALGFLRWFEADQSDRPLHAPILLIPMALDRSNVREGFTLRQLDEDARINVTLIKRLEQLGVRVPNLESLPEDEHGYDVPRILDIIRNAVRERPRWAVANDVTLCILTFAKFLMWVDLEKNEDMLRKNDIVRHLVDTPFEPFRQGPFPPEAELGRTHSPSSLFCPVDADASQLAAIAASAADRSFVLQGPPGTGKSQTITNLIANELALGRKVLFVSEKMAALNVVHTRLVAAGLAPFCLEAHSTKVSKDSLRKQLKEAFEVSGNEGADAWLSKARSLEGLRQDLNAYAETLHAPQSCGLRPFDAYATLIHDRAVPAVTLTLGDVAAVDQDRLERMRSAVARLSRLADATHPSADHPLRAVYCRIWSEALEREAVDLAKTASTAVAVLKQLATPVVAAIAGLPVEELSWNQIEFLSRLASILSERTGVPRALLVEPDWVTVSARLKVLIARGRRRDTDRRDLLSRWTPEFLGADHAAFLRDIAAARAGAFVKRWFRQREITGRLRVWTADGRRPGIDEAEDDLRRAAGVQAESASLADPAGEPALLFGSQWAGGVADWDALDSLLGWTTRFRAFLDAPPWPIGSRLASLCEGWIEIAAGESRRASGHQAAARAFAEAVESVRGRLRALEGKLEIDGNRAWGADDEPAFDSRATVRLQALLGALSDLPDWCAYRSEAADAASLGLGPLILALDEGVIPPGHLEAAFERSFAAWLLEACRKTSPVLERFNSVAHEARIDEFRRTDTTVRDLTSEAVKARLLARRPPTDLGENTPRTSETGKIKRFIDGGRGAIRKLFLECRNVLPLYKPCFLMSPLSVAQFLDKDFPPFDVVVFDEASQMPVWEAVGAIARGKRLVVVGDSKQLPPTSFFDKRTGDDDFDEDAIQDEESILDECRSAQLMPLTLKWHYRSRHEDLIAFSNRQYYENRLLTFPSAGLKQEGLGVHWREVSGGIYDARQSRTNRKEAEAVVADVVRRLLDRSGQGPSIGIVTFSVAQQKLVEDLLDRARREHSAIEDAFVCEKEPVFVKNLETVQGDERDVILFSVCYGPDAKGAVALRFGPLNAKGGERRLNVAITRARQELVVFSTLRPEQIDLSRTQAMGVAHLKAFLDYARRGPAALGDQTSAPGSTCESYFEQAVHDALAARGWSLHKQVGCSGYRIDLAVVDPKSPGRYALGIECDGANYHSSKSARDRDRLRASVLRDLGWTLHRIWSADWWRDPQREIEKAEKAIRLALDFLRSGTRLPSQGAPSISSVAATAPLKVAEMTAPTPGVASARAGGVQPYTSLRGDAIPADGSAVLPRVSARARPFVPWTPPGELLGDGVQFYDTGHSPRVRWAIAELVRCEGPVEFGRLVKGVAACWGLQRATERAQMHVRALVRGTPVRLRKAGAREFAWHSTVDAATWAEFRVPTGGQSRKGEEVCPEEVAAAAADVLDMHISLDEGDLLQQVARLFGIQRVGDKVRQYLLEGLRVLEMRGGAARRGAVVERAVPRSQSGG